MRNLRSAPNPQSQRSCFTLLPSQTQTDPLDTPESGFVLACASDMLYHHRPASVKNGAQCKVLLLGCNNSLIQFEEPAFIIWKLQLHQFKQLVLGRGWEHKLTQALSTGKDDYDKYLCFSTWFTSCVSICLSYPVMVHLNCPHLFFNLLWLFFQVHC